MDFTYSETQNDIAGLAKKIFADAAGPRLWRALADAGLLGVALPEAAGGSGHGFLELCALLEQAGAAVAPVPLWSTLVAALPLARFGGHEALLARVASGDAVLGLGLEAGLRAEGGRLTGTISCVAAAHDAAAVLVAAGDRLCVVDPREATLEQQTATDGQVLARMTFAGARAEALPPEALEWTRQRAAVALCALELGVVARALRMTAEYTSQRKQFDRPIATFQAVAQRAADAYIDVETVRVTTWQAAWLLSEERDAAAATAIAKWAAAEAGHRVVYAAQHLHGGIGFDKDYPLHRYYLASRQLELTLGGATRQLVRLGDLLMHAEG